MRKRISFLALLDYLLYYPLIVLARRRVKEISGLENIPITDSIILAVNHIDYLDGWLLELIILAELKRRSHFITKSKNYFWTHGLVIPLEKYGPQESLKKAHDLVKENKIIIFFPEGRRNSEKALLKSKTGVARLALGNKCQVIPVGIIGPSYSSFGVSVCQTLLHPRAVVITVGRPLNLSSYYRQEINYDLLEKCIKEIMQAVGELAGKSYPY